MDVKRHQRGIGLWRTMACKSAGLARCASRLNGATNLAIYNQAISNLQSERVMTLLGASGLAQVLDDFRVGLA
jgi:hypothetical protein